MKTISLGLVLAGMTGWAMVQDGTIVKSADVKWVDAKALAAGAKACFIHGDPTKEASTCLLKFAAGTVIPAHWHSSDEIVTVNSGSILFGFGEKVDEAKGTLLESGAYIVIPAKKAHWAVAKSETVLTKHSTGIGDFNPCK